MPDKQKYIKFKSTYNGKERIAKASQGVHSVFSVLVSNGKSLHKLKIFANKQVWLRYRRANPGIFISRIDYNGAVNETEATSRTKVIE